MKNGVNTKSMVVLFVAGFLCIEKSPKKMYHHVNYKVLGERWFNFE